MERLSLIALTVCLSLVPKPTKELETLTEYKRYLEHVDSEDNLGVVKTIDSMIDMYEGEEKPCQALTEYVNSLEKYLASLTEYYIVSNTDTPDNEVYMIRTIDYRPLTDLSNLSSEEERAVRDLHLLGVVSGDKDRKYHGDKAASMVEVETMFDGVTGVFRLRDWNDKQPVTERDVVTYAQETLGLRVNHEYSFPQVTLTRAQVAVIVKDIIDHNALTDVIRSRFIIPVKSQVGLVRGFRPVYPKEYKVSVDDYERYEDVLTEEQLTYTKEMFM